MMCRWLLAGAIILATMGCSPTAADPGQIAPEEKNLKNDSWRKMVDLESAGKVPVVLRVRLLKHQGSDKYGWDTVKLIGVIKNTSSFKFPDEFEVAHYSGEPGIPDGQSTVYLEQFNPKSDSIWKLLEGSGVKGVSHHNADNQS
jgi:hypothetical protein